MHSLWRFATGNGLLIDDGRGVVTEGGDLQLEGTGVVLVLEYLVTVELENHWSTCKAWKTRAQSEIEKRETAGGEGGSTISEEQSIHLSSIKSYLSQLASMADGSRCHTLEHTHF